MLKTTTGNLTIFGNLHVWTAGAGSMTSNSHPTTLIAPKP